MNEYEMAFIGGGVIAAMWIVVYLLCWCCQWAWAWMDDSKVYKANLIVYFLAKKWGFKDDDTDCVYFSHPALEGYGEGALPFFVSLWLTASIPFFLVLTFNFSVIALIVVSLVGSAYLTRVVLRQKKLLDKHMADKEAHNGES